MVLLHYNFQFEVGIKCRTYVCNYYQ